MAEGGHPASVLYTPGGAVSSDSALSTKPIMPTSKSSVEVLTSSSDLPKEPGHICQEGLKQAISKTSNEHPIRETDSQMVSGENGVQVAVPTLQNSVSGHPPERCASPRTLVRPHSIAEPYTTPHHHEEEVSVTSHSPRASRRTVQRLQPASLPVQRSHSDSIPLVKQGPQPSHSEACGLAYGGDYSIQEAQGHSILACKQPMQLQHCNIVTTACRGANSGGGSPTQQPQGSCIHPCAVQAAKKVGDFEGEGCHHPQCKEALCCDSYIHHGNLEDTFAAYCHPQPIPAPAQLLPHIASMEAGCRVQCAVLPHSTTNMIALPRLMSSVSETGLDAKRLLRCCNLNCSWISSLHPGGMLQTQKHSGVEECCSSPVSRTTTTRDTGTMTAHKELRDVGVQTSRTISEPAPLQLQPHVFPQICLVEDNGSEATCNQSTSMEADGGSRQSGAQKTPVKEVKWDAEGMTWEVYGASLDPEELGLAIQKHLELQIKETASRATKLSRQDTNTSWQSGKTRCQRKRSRMMSSIRTPACCARNTTAVD